MISPEEWTHLPISKHHYAQTIAQAGGEVYFLNPPTNTFTIKTTLVDNVFEVNYKGFTIGLRFLPDCVQRWEMKKQFESLQKLCNTKFDCIWSFDNSVFFDFTAIPQPTLTILHLVDYSQNFQFARAAKTAVLCLGISDNIVERLRIYNHNSYKIPHGLSTKGPKQAGILPGKNKIKALYSGNLDMIYIDWNLAQLLINGFPQLDFIFLGPFQRKYVDGENVYFLGRVPQQDLLSFCSATDILLVLYDYDRFPEQLTNAHKILEYLYSGKIIVSTFLKDYEETDLFLMAKSKTEYVRLFQQAVETIDACNSELSQEKRTRFALKNTYTHRLQEIENHIEKTKGYSQLK